MPSEADRYTAFIAFHESHPEVYQHLLSGIRRWKNAGNHEHGSFRMFWEVMRYDLSLEKSTASYKFNNNLAPFYARLIDQTEPDLKGLFELRARKKEETHD